jgi:hypothetical protein
VFFHFISYFYPSKMCVKCFTLKLNLSATFINIISDAT